jgi:PPE-repeat protein
MDFGALPPEINSARMYLGPGSAPMLAAATAWSGLAAELNTTASGYQSVILQLTGDGWLGPASAAMAAAAAPYVTWLNVTGVGAEQTAANASSAAAAYEAAFAMTVAPAEIAANRALLAALVATNFLGQNTPAIAATEAQYGQMWAQDAAAMYGYAASSAAASTLTSFTQPAQTTNPAGQADQAATVAQAVGTAAGGGAQDTLSQVISTLPSALQSLASPVSASGLGNILGLGGSNVSAAANPLAAGGIAGFLNSNFVNGIVSGGYINPAIISPAVLSGLSDVNSLQTPGSVPPVPGGMDLPAFAGYVAGHGPAASPALGGMTARSALVGRLSVPQGWVTATQVANHSGTAFPGGGWTSSAAPQATSGPMPGMPGVPMASGGGHSFGNGPRYGFRPTIMSRPPAAG